MQRSVALQVGVSWATRTNRTSPLGIFEAALNLVTRIIGHFPRYFIHVFALLLTRPKLSLFVFQYTESRRGAAERIWQQAFPFYTITGFLSDF